MRIGICGGLDVAERAREAGFEYLEVGASGFALRADFDAEEYRRAGAETSNLFFPGSIHLQGPHATPYREYVEAAVARAAKIGLAIMVIGSGASRKAPDGVPVEEANERFIEIAAEVQEVAEPYGIVVAPESLNRSETNVGNDLGDLALSLAAMGVAYAADSYHVVYEWDATGGTGQPDWAAQLPLLPAHVHVSNLQRKAPAVDDPLMIGFFDRLRELGYDGRVSLEANLPDLTVETLRSAYEALHALAHR
jgi:D-psicose/D-tagatose/L-ribulose 3-epimerase